MIPLLCIQAYFCPQVIETSAFQTPHISTSKHLDVESCQVARGDPFLSRSVYVHGQFEKIPEIQC